MRADLHILETSDSLSPSAPEQVSSLKSKWEINDSVPELPVRYLLDVKRERGKKNFIWVRASPLVTEDLLAAVSVTDCVGISTGCLHGNRD